MSMRKKLIVICDISVKLILPLIAKEEHLFCPKIGLYRVYLLPGNEK